MTGVLRPRMASTSEPAMAERVAGLDWPRLATDLDAHGCAVVHAVLSPQECVGLAETYAADEPFRSRIVMARHGFGRGEYKYFAYPLPDVVASLWDIDDAVSRRFFTAFHRGLLDAGDPLVALRRTQLAFLHDGDPSLAHPASWAAFICMGGLDPHSFSKGELS